MKCILFCINYNSFESLINYLNSINIAYNNVTDKLELIVVIVDNSNKFKKVNTKNYSFNVIHIETKSNLGYFGGFSYGIKKCKENIKTFNYIMVSNVDLIMNQDFFNKLVYLKTEPDVGCIAPSIISKKEKIDRNPKILKRYSVKSLKKLMLMYKFPILYYMYRLLFYTKRRKKVNHESEQIIYGAHGAFMIFKNNFSDFLSNFVYPTFLFGEEIFCAEHLRLNNLKTIYKKELVVYDSEHISTSKMKKKYYFECNYNALKTIIKEFY